MKIPFNKPFIPQKTMEYITDVISQGHLSGNGPYAKRCHGWLELKLNCQMALLTPSGTAALEMAALLADIQAGDEVIMPSFTFPSTANAFVLRGGVPVFVDIRPDTCNLDETKIEAAITPKTRAIVPVHYAGVACEMDTIMAIAKKHGLLVIEDAAQGAMSCYKGKSLGSIGQLAALSFHDTKNLTAGEAGALLVNDPRFMDKAEIVRDKGTDRGRFFRGEVDRYSWVDEGSSYLPNAFTEAFLWAQLEQAESITQRRLEIWNRYHLAFEGLEKANKVRRPTVPEECAINAHIYYLILPGLEQRNAFIDRLSSLGIKAVFHYVPLHSSAAGRKYGRTSGELRITQKVSESLVRLPLWIGLEPHLDGVIQGVIDVVGDQVFGNSNRGNR